MASLLFLHLLTILSFTFLLPEPVIAQQYPYHNCTGTRSYSPGTPYDNNLRQLLNDFRNNTPTPGGFANSSVGEGSDKVYGLVLCGGGFERNERCTRCVIDAALSIQPLCAYKTQGVIWYQFCLLRYSEEDFFGKVEMRDLNFFQSGANYSELMAVNRTLSGLLFGLVERATSDPSLFAIQMGVPVAGHQTLSGWVQCTRDLSSQGCSECLRHGIEQMFKCCSRSSWVQMLGESCIMRYWVVAATGWPAASPSASSSNTTGRNGLSSTVIAIISISTTFFGVLFFACVCYCLWRRKERLKGNIGEHVPSKKDGEGKELPLFDLDTLKAATNNFSDQNKLGKGGFGPVYKGKLSDGQEIAVKRLSRSSGQGLEEFRNEVVVIAKLQHRNLVRLLGCCLESEEKLLVYEYMHNGSLDAYIFDSSKKQQLQWRKRFDIVVGIARGLLYLHQDSRLRIIHRDLKASNVLLDHEMNPKISDFGMARIFETNQTQANTNRVVGTYGYMAPEYAMDGLFSMKSDVFSFGILLLEIICGKKNTGLYLRESSQSLLGTAWRLWHEGKGMEFTDPVLCQSRHDSEILRCIQIGLLCVQEDPMERPNMTSTLSMLNNEAVALPVPREPTFLVERRIPRVESDPSSSSIKTHSTNRITISEIKPR
ncbi:hypothetical protein AMTRI_Chr02g217720 [Amborella trichopoda]|uniref:non-specific serine/threonine protein kinase n=1 Tax=Amborella trichopoda TaxID=13333 RepID=W1PX17_AMBTC|nr:cysteine-rich receptor-like protein kinase 10 [Amborella trichopoda]ERN12728.1 hypothetical protein AMTR_s00043p00100060 [Amborella trichopoda]|eukprot:XP_006851147.1 cysteine-rich receptor-like protein kinase 10 [Amborella trichopoda]